MGLSGADPHAFLHDRLDEHAGPREHRATRPGGTTMTMTERPILAPYAPVTLSLYRDIHKGIRAELFGVTGEAGRLDPSDRPARAALATHVRDVVHLLVMHAAHEDRSVQPTIETILPDVAEEIATDHDTLEARIELVRDLADDALDAGRTMQRDSVQRVYIELASFTSAYL